MPDGSPEMYIETGNNNYRETIGCPFNGVLVEARIDNRVERKKSASAVSSSMTPTSLFNS
jgi:hypothetical protein